MAYEAIEILVWDASGLYLDLTAGGGGHSKLILERLRTDGSLIACDRDPDAVQQTRDSLPASTTILKCRFSEIGEAVGPIAKRPISGVLMDLGVSSYQIDQPGRGFSHRFAAPLDLRMDPSSGESAAELLARLSEKQLEQFIRDFGEDNQARRIARAIVKERLRLPIETTDRLAGIITRSVPATANKSLARVFQALRIAVNREMDELDEGLTAAWGLLGLKGRLVVISYHSLEDRRVKTFIKSVTEPMRDFMGVPITQTVSGRSLTRKPVIPNEDEVHNNPRARSAKLRAVEKNS